MPRRTATLFIPYSQAQGHPPVWERAQTAPVAATTIIARIKPARLSANTRSTTHSRSAGWSFFRRLIYSGPQIRARMSQHALAIVLESRGSMGPRDSQAPTSRSTPAPSGSVAPRPALGCASPRRALPFGLAFAVIRAVWAVPRLFAEEHYRAAWARYWLGQTTPSWSPTSTSARRSGTPSFACGVATRRHSSGSWAGPARETATPRYAR